MSETHSDETGFWQCEHGHAVLHSSAPRIAEDLKKAICPVVLPSGDTCSLLCDWIQKEKPSAKALLDVIDKELDQLERELQQEKEAFAKKCAEIKKEIAAPVEITPRIDELLLLKGGVVIDPTNRHPIREADVLIVNGKIHAVGRNIEFTNKNLPTVDVTGMLVMPGLVDLHVHFREPGTEGETIATGVEAAVAGGFTTVCVMPNTNPAIDRRERVEWQRETAAKHGKARVQVVGAITVDRAGKEVDAGLLNAMVKGGAVALSDDGNGVQNAELMLKAMLVAADLGIPISDHAEFSCLAGPGVINLGTISESWKVKGKPPIAEEAMIARDIELARATGVHLHVGHISTARGVELVRRAKHEGIHVTAEVTPHHLILNETHLVRNMATEPDVVDMGLDPNKKMNPPLRTNRDCVALWEGLIDGTIDAIATDHAPHPDAKKKLGIVDAPNGVTGLETAFSSIYTRTRAMAVTSRLLSPVRLVELFSTGPARLFNLPGGTLRHGAPADVTVFNGDSSWRVNPDVMRSQSKNTAFAGQWLNGEVIYTIVGGKIVYDNSKKNPHVASTVPHPASDWALSFCSSCGVSH